MIISTKHGIAFLCTPKCASTSIEAALKDSCNIHFNGSPPSIKHINARQFSRHILPLHGKLAPDTPLESFCLIRDPLDWVGSWYRYRTRPDIKNSLHSKDKKNYTGEISFSQFAERQLSGTDQPSTAHLIGSQYRFASLTNGEIGVDRIFPMDRIDLVSRYLSVKIGKPIHIPEKNVSPRLALKLDDELKARLLQHFSKDVALYNFVKTHGQYDKSLHANELASVLQIKPVKKQSQKHPPQVSLNKKSKRTDKAP